MQPFPNHLEVTMKINRRSFLKRALAAGSMAVGTGSLVSACSGFRRTDLPDQDLSKPISGQLDQIGGAILYYASLAPSGHNAQPWFVRNFINPQDFMKLSFRKQSIDLTAKLAWQGGGWFVITSEGQTVADLIDSGRKFERMALMARERKLAIQPMTQYLEEKEGLQQIAANHAASVIPQFMLRVGYLKNYPDPVSLRRPVSWFVRS